MGLEGKKLGFEEEEVALALALEVKEEVLKEKDVIGMNRSIEGFERFWLPTFLLRGLTGAKVEEGKRSWDETFAKVTKVAEEIHMMKEEDFFDRVDNLRMSLIALEARLGYDVSHFYDRLDVLEHIAKRNKKALECAKVLKKEAKLKDENKLMEMEIFSFTSEACQRAILHR
ncbi:hypothetical protein QJS10_CPA03g01885 [Acorus calamus]|uniref:Uncharacterized protein n=1 Tax=Acorus calamus TaxID=4465 RepID=A0AAV9F4W6_ACOCL|nr:hypothetical protein QJS10_CPA03g01885 [Acorus calamus]